MSIVFPDVTLSIKQRHYALVIDPLLALSPYGLSLTRQLNTLLDTWIPRGLRHIIDNTSMYLHLPHQLSVFKLKSFAKNKQQQQVILSVLQEWESFQNITHEHNKLFYFADALQESSLPEKLDSNAIWQFEALSSSLDSRLQDNSSKSLPPQENCLTDANPLLSAYRDTLALALTIPSAIILTQLSTAEPDDEHEEQEAGKNTSQCSMPLLCQQACEWDIPMILVDANDDWLRIERDFIRQQLALTGFAKFHWFARLQQPDLRLAVLHVVAPSASLALYQTQPDFGAYPAINMAMDKENNGEIPDYWQSAAGFWYPL